MLLISRVTMFFLLDYGDHLDLHSFPTRRSSDLALALRFSARRTTRLRCNTDSNGACNGILIRPLSPFVADHEREQATNKSGPTQERVGPLRSDSGKSEIGRASCRERV